MALADGLSTGDLMVWTVLQNAGNRSFGLRVPELAQQTTFDIEVVYQSLAKLEDRGFISSKLRQVGTSGTMDRFYRITEAAPKT